MYWYAVRERYDNSKNTKRGAPVVSGPFTAYQEAKEDMYYIGQGFQKTGVFNANNKEEAEAKAEKESYI